MLGNSIKFTETGSISLDVSFDQADDTLKMSVRDTGIGMSAEEQRNIFSPFVQADPSTTRKYGGTGLGLTIARDLVLLMGGRLNVASKSGHGTCIDVYMKSISTENGKILIPESKRVPAGTSGGNRNQLRGKVLLVEDNPDLRKLVSAWISKTGAEVSVAENGQVALDKIDAHRFDLVFMDMQMPVMGGIEAIRFMRKSGISIPIVVLSGDEVTRDGESYQSIGANDYLAKPINQRRLSRILEKYLENIDAGINNSRHAV